MDLAIGEAEGVFRTDSQGKYYRCEQFRDRKSDRFVEELLSNLALITCVP